MSSDFCQFLILLVRQHGALLHVKQGNCSYWWILLLLLCCRVLWFKNLTHKLTWWFFSQPSLTFQSLIWRDTGGGGGVRACQHFEEGGRDSIHYIQILSSFIVFKCISGVWFGFKAVQFCMILHPGTLFVDNLFTRNPAKGLNSGTPHTAWKNKFRNLLHLMLIYLQVAWQSPSTTQLRTRATIQSVYFKVKCISCPHQMSSDTVLPARTPQPPTISPSFMSDLISRSCEMATTFSIFLISQMPLSRFASLKRRFGVLFESLVELGVTFKDMRDLQDVYSALWLVKPGQVWGAIMANLLSKRPSVFHGNIVTVWCWCFYPKMLWWKNGIVFFFSPAIYDY